jgi:hypothetical protein
LVTSLAAINFASVVDNAIDSCRWLTMQLHCLVTQPTCHLLTVLFWCHLQSQHSWTLLTLPYCYQLSTANHSCSLPTNTWGHVWHQSSLPQLVDPLLKMLTTQQMLCLDMFPSLGTWEIGSQFGAIQLRCT